MLNYLKRYSYLVAVVALILGITALVVASVANNKTVQAATNTVTIKNTYAHYMANSTQSSIAASASAAIVWNPAEVDDVPLFAIDERFTGWDATNTKFTPGKAGLFHIVWSYNSGDVTNEVSINKNSTTMTTASSIALSSGLEGTIVADFRVVNDTDFVTFTVMNNKGAIVTPTANRNQVTVTRIRV